MAKHAYEVVRPADERGRISSTFPRSVPPGADLAYALHDARNLLSIISSNVGWLRGQAGPDLGEVMDDLARATDRLHALLESTLARANRDEERAGLTYRLVRVTEILRDATSGFRHPARGVRVEITRQGDDIVEVDPELTSRMLANLLGNAVRHSPDGGVVTVLAEVYDGKFTLTVSDQGAGVGPERREAIFQLGAAGAVHGLGLKFCRRAAQQHGGTVELAPSVGGAVFVAVLPAQPPTNGEEEDARWPTGDDRPVTETGVRRVLRR